jgi:hypothetical protein
MLDVELHQVDQRGAACREANIGALLCCLGSGARYRFNAGDRLPGSLHAARTGRQSSQDDVRALVGAAD